MDVGLFGLLAWKEDAHFTCHFFCSWFGGQLSTETEQDIDLQEQKPGGMEGYRAHRVDYNHLTNIPCHARQKEIAALARVYLDFVSPTQTLV